MPLRVLITRPEPMASQMAARVREIGHDPVIIPLTIEERLPIDATAIGEADGWILTSARAAWVLEHLPRRPVYAVGEATAEAARMAGAASVTSGTGGWRELARLIIERHSAKGAEFVHLAGEETIGDLASALNNAGHVYERCVVYRMRRDDRAMGGIGRLLADRAVDAVVLMSPRAASMVIEIVRSTETEDLLSSVRAICLSPAIAELCQALGTWRIETAPAPKLAALLGLLAECKDEC